MHLIGRGWVTSLGMVAAAALSAAPVQPWMATLDELAAEFNGWIVAMVPANPPTAARIAEIRAPGNPVQWSALLCEEVGATIAYGDGEVLLLACPQVVEYPEVLEELRAWYADEAASLRLIASLPHSIVDEMYAGRDVTVADLDEQQRADWVKLLRFEDLLDQIPLPKDVDEYTDEELLALPIGFTFAFTASMQIEGEGWDSEPFGIFDYGRGLIRDLPRSDRPAWMKLPPGPGLARKGRRSTSSGGTAAWFSAPHPVHLDTPREYTLGEVVQEMATAVGATIILDPSYADMRFCATRGDYEGRDLLCLGLAACGLDWELDEHQMSVQPADNRLRAALYDDQKRLGAQAMEHLRRLPFRGLPFFESDFQTDGDVPLTELSALQQEFVIDLAWNASKDLTPSPSPLNRSVLRLFRALWLDAWYEPGGQGSGQFYQTRLYREPWLWQRDGAAQ